MKNTEFAEYVRTLVRGDDEANERIEQELDRTGWDGYPHFLAVAFFLAVDKRFSRPADTAEIIRFVADTRAELGDDGPAIDQHLAERLIRSVLDDSARVEATADAEMIGRIQSLVLYEILSDGRLTDEHVDSFLAEAARLADR